MEERLQKVIARAGVASRRDAEKLIESGRVTVNGQVVRELGQKVDPRIDEVRVDTLALPQQAALGEDKRTYLLLMKPKGVICTVRDPQGRPTVLDLCPPFQGKRLYPVGRLDEDSEGIVLLTNDGELTEQLTHPRFRVPKIYDVRVKGRMTGESAREFEQGIWLSDGRTGRSRVRLGRRGPKVSHVNVTLTEGRNRELRRAFAKLGHPVLSLRRVQIGPVVPRGLKIGQYRPLDAEEIAALREVVAGGSSRPVRRNSGSRPPRSHPSTSGPSSASGERDTRSRTSTPRPTGKPGARPDGRPTGRPGERSGGRPTGKPGARPGGRPTGKPGARPGGRPTGKPGARPGARPTGKPGARPGGKPSGSRGGGRPPAQQGKRSPGRSGGSKPGRSGGRGPGSRDGGKKRS